MILTNKNNPYNIPDNYFENLSENIMQGIHHSHNADDDVSEMLANLSDINPFSIPHDDYFNNLSETILNDIHAHEGRLELINTIPDINISLPEANYFDNLSSRIMDNIYNQELDTTFIDGFKDDVADITVPKNYFNNLSQNILEKIHHSQENEVVNNIQPTIDIPQPTPKKLQLKLSSWLAAACILIVFSVGGFWMFNSNDTTPVSGSYLAANTLNSVSDEDIIKYLENDADNYDIYSLIDYKASAKSQDANSQIEMYNINAEDIDAYLEFEGI